MSRRPPRCRRSPLRVEQLETRTQPVVLPYGGIVAGTVSSPTEIVEYTFLASAGDKFTLALTSTPTQDGFDAIADLLAPSGTSVDSFGASGQRYEVAPETGTYRLRVHDYDSLETGTFTLGLEGIKPISPGSVALVRGGITGGTIDAAIDVKQFTFTGAINDVITLALTSTAVQAGFDAIVDVFGPSGTLIDSFGATGQRYITLTETGTIMVQVHDYDYIERGAFTIGLEGIHPISPNPIALVPGGFVSGTIATGIEVKQYTFRANDGDIFGLSLTSTATQAGFDAIADVFAPSGTRIDSFGATGLRYLTAEETGTFMVQMHDYDYAQAGNFKIGLEGIKPASPDALALPAATAVAGTISQRNDVVQYTFYGRANDQIKMTLTGTAIESGFDVIADVFDPAGALVDSFGVVSQRALTLRSTGVYLVQMHDYDFTQAGRFTFLADWGTTAGTASLRGSVYNDANLSGTRQLGEAGLAGRVLYVDANNNGKRDSTERSTATDVAGNYTFTALPARATLIRENLPAGWFATSPANGVLSVTLPAGQNLVRDFGNTQQNLATAAISGRVFNDANGNGIRNVGELGLGLWTVFIDANRDGILQSTERSVQTDVHGNWTLRGLPVGTYIVRVLPLVGTRITTPASGYFRISLTLAQKVYSKFFGVMALS